jgi:CYTH domain-containing protein
MDAEAYIGAEAFESMINRLGYTYHQLCNGRYDAVFHLRTAALGMEDFYTLSNNVARTESKEAARILDQKTLDSWVRHRHPRVIGNSADFGEKIRRLFAEVCEILGDPVPLEREDKFLVGSFDPTGIPVKFHKNLIVQNYLTSPDSKEERRVRAQSDQSGVSCYYYTVKRELSLGVRTEEERMISENEYETLFALRDPDKLSIRKERVCFFWKEQFFEIDLFEEPQKGLILMEAERTDRTPKLELPLFVNVIRNVTGEEKYSNFGIASKR